jgi:hypothetical protein
MNTLTFAFDVELGDGDKVLAGTQVVISDRKPTTNGDSKKQEIIDNSVCVIVPEFFSKGKKVKRSFEAGFSKDCFI